MRLLVKFCSVAIIVFLVYVHLGPANLQPPRSGLGWQLDHLLGYFVATSIVWTRLAAAAFCGRRLAHDYCCGAGGAASFYTGSPC
jgi:hypothetical protein